MILIAGPSSSGKTTFSKRLSVQLIACGLKPVPISTDDYFVDREHTPRDENGEYDFEHIDAMNIDLLTAQLNAMVQGEEVEPPRFNYGVKFTTERTKTETGSERYSDSGGYSRAEPETDGGGAR